MENLIRKFTVDDESDFVPTKLDSYYEDRAVNEPELRLPFGFCNERWEAINAEMQPSDELWTFRSPDWTWDDYVGREGIVLLREGQAVATILTKMS